MRIKLTVEELLILQNDRVEMHLQHAERSLKAMSEELAKAAFENEELRFLLNRNKWPRYAKSWDNDHVFCWASEEQNCRNMVTGEEFICRFQDRDKERMKTISPESAKRLAESLKAKKGQP